MKYILIEILAILVTTVFCIVTNKSENIQIMLARVWMFSATIVCSVAFWIIKGIEIIL